MKRCIFNEQPEICQSNDDDDDDDDDNNEDDNMTTTTTTTTTTLTTNVSDKCAGKQQKLNRSWSDFGQCITS